MKKVTYKDVYGEAHTRYKPKWWHRLMDWMISETMTLEEREYYHEQAERLRRKTMLNTMRLQKREEQETLESKQRSNRKLVATVKVKCFVKEGRRSQEYQGVWSLLESDTHRFRQWKELRKIDGAYSVRVVDTNGAMQDYLKGTDEYVRFVAGWGRTGDLNLLRELDTYDKWSVAIVGE